MTESDRTTLKKSTVTVFRLVATGMPSEKKYDLWGWQLGRDPMRIFSNVQFDEAGTVLNPSDKQTLSVAFDGLSKGEPVRAALVSEDEQVVASAKVIPFPIEVADGSCHVAVERVVLGQTFGVRGTGFTAGEQVAISCKCKKNELQAQAKAAADAQGTWVILIAANEARERSGTTPLEFIGRTCRLGLDLVWGKSALKIQ